MKTLLISATLIALLWDSGVGVAAAKADDRAPVLPGSRPGPRGSSCRHGLKRNRAQEQLRWHLRLRTRPGQDQAHCVSRIGFRIQDQGPSAKARQIGSRSGLLLECDQDQNRLQEATRIGFKIKTTARARTRSHTPDRPGQ